MGLAKIIFGFDKHDLKELEMKVSSLESELSKLREEKDTLENSVREFRGLVDRLAGELERSYGIIASLVNEIDAIKKELEELKQQDKQCGVEGDTNIDQVEEHLEVDEEALDSYEGDDAEKLVIEAISKGINSPSDIVSYTGLSKSKVYAILRELTEEGVLVKKKEGRRVHYIIAGAGTVESPA